MGIVLRLCKMPARFSLALRSSSWEVVEVTSFVIRQFLRLHLVCWQWEHRSLDMSIYAELLMRRLSWSIGSAPRSGRLVPWLGCYIHGGCGVDLDCSVPLNHWFDTWLFSNGHSCARCPSCWQLAHHHSLSVGQSVDLCPMSRHQKHLPSWRHRCLSSDVNQLFTWCWLIQSFVDLSVESNFGLPLVCW